MRCSIRSKPIPRSACSSSPAPDAPSPSGYDLNSVAERSAATTGQTAGSAFEVMVDRLEDLGVPTICRLNGGVYGGSTDLALACDFRIGVDTAEMFMPAARLGLHYYTSGIRRYVSRLGADNAKKLFLTAEKIGAPEMLRIGYLTAMVPAEALDEEVDRLATLLGGQRAGRDGRHEAHHQRDRARQARRGRSRRPRPRLDARRRRSRKASAPAPRSGRRSSEADRCIDTDTAAIPSARRRDVSAYSRRH